MSSTFSDEENSASDSKSSQIDDEETLTTPVTSTYLIEKINKENREISTTKRLMILLPQMKNTIVKYIFLQNFNYYLNIVYIFKIYIFFVRILQSNFYVKIYYQHLQML